MVEQTVYCFYNRSEAAIELFIEDKLKEGWLVKFICGNFFKHCYGSGIIIFEREKGD